MYTFADYIITAFIAIFIILISLSIIHWDIENQEFGKKKNYWISIITILLSIAIIFGQIKLTLWYNTNTAQGIRNVKDFQSQINNGIEREITITSEDGRQIFHYEGKVDIESNHTDNYIKFESEEGKRHIIYYGIQDTIIIKEK